MARENEHVTVPCGTCGARVPSLGLLVGHEKTTGHPRDIRLMLESMVAVSETGCWVWQGTRHQTGYGRAGHALTHRLAYEAFVGPIPPGLQIDHLCRNRLCVNPAHLEAVTQVVNILRGVGLTAINARKTHCKHGHEFTPANTIADRGGRKCRTCLRIRDRGRCHRAKALSS